MAKAKNKNNKTPAKGNKKNTKKQKKPSPIVKSTRTERVIREKTRKVPSHIDLSKEKENFKHVVRIVNKDIPGHQTIGESLTIVYGISNRLGRIIESVFEKKINKHIDKVGYLTEEEIRLLEKTINNIHNEVPFWVLNRAKLFTQGDKKHLTMADLRLELRKDLQRLGRIKSYRGLRLQWGLPVRGQKTKSTFRKSGGTVGVSKKKS
jgi:small subunit ribosomal protein S13